MMAAKKFYLHLTEITRIDLLYPLMLVWLTGGGDDRIVFPTRIFGVIIQPRSSNQQDTRNKAGIYAMI